MQRLLEAVMIAALLGVRPAPVAMPEGQAQARHTEGPGIQVQCCTPKRASHAR